MAKQSQFFYRIAGVNPRQSPKPNAIIFQVTARARDPEGGPVRYALVSDDEQDSNGGGDDFSVEEGCDGQVLWRRRDAQAEVVGQAEGW